MNTDENAWGVDLCVRPSGRITVRLIAHARVAVHVLTSPAHAMELLQGFLADFESLQDELMLFMRDARGTQAWSTRSRWAGLYWCAALLARIWPPPWVPSVERRGHREGLTFVEPPLIERRGARRSDVPHAREFSRG